MKKLFSLIAFTLIFNLNQTAFAITEDEPAHEFDVSHQTLPQASVDKNDRQKVIIDLNVGESSFLKSGYEKTAIAFLITEKGATKRFRCRTAREGDKFIFHAITNRLLKEDEKLRLEVKCWDPGDTELTHVPTVTVTLKKSQIRLADG